MPQTQTQTGTVGAAFKVVHGPLYLAAKHASGTNGATLVVVDEINRGPAVAIFGDSITAIERDKRMRADGQLGPLTERFRTLDASGNPEEVAVPHHLYLLAAMNEADTSVEPLDVAFRRRWQLFRLLPDEKLLRDFLGLPANPQPLPGDVGNADDLLEAAVQAWRAVNERIALGRGEEFEIGHGIFMDNEGAPKDLTGAPTFVTEVWKRIHAHAAEVFFGDTRGLAFVIGAGAGKPYNLQERVFADNPVPVLKAPDAVNAENIYAVLLAASTAPTG